MCGLRCPAAVLQRGVQATLQAAACRVDDVTFSFVGIPCHGEDSALQAQLDALPAAVLPAGRYRCGNDMVCGWAGSLGAVDGINIVAGTGSIAYGEWQGRSARAGGCGRMSPCWGEKSPDHQFGLSRGGRSRRRYAGRTSGDHATNRDTGVWSEL